MKLSLVLNSLLIDLYPYDCSTSFLGIPIVPPLLMYYVEDGRFQPPYSFLLYILVSLNLPLVHFDPVSDDNWLRTQRFEPLILTLRFQNPGSGGSSRRSTNQDYLDSSTLLDKDPHNPSVVRLERTTTTLFDGNDPPSSSRDLGDRPYPF